MRICVYAIALNEAKFAARFAETSRAADLVLVADTGSSDGTVDILRDHGVTVHSIAIRPWRFDDARNAALALVPDDIDICVSLDLDEVLSDGWRDVLEAKWTPPANRLLYTLIYAHNADGSPSEQFIGHRIHARHGYRWRYPCHEELYADRIEEHAVLAPELRIEHFPDPDKSRGQYLPLLEQAVRETPNNRRMSHCLGRELLGRQRHAEAIVELERCLILSGDERDGLHNATLRYIGWCHYALGDSDAWLGWLKRAAAAGPSMRGPWAELTKAHAARGEWRDCYDAALRTMRLPGGAQDYGVDTETPIMAEDLACLAAWNLGLHDEALDLGRRAAALAPGDERIAENLRRMEGVLRRAAPARP